VEVSLYLIVRLVLSFWSISFAMDQFLRNDELSLSSVLSSLRQQGLQITS
jgi:hypothetical protein